MNKSIESSVMWPGAYVIEESEFSHLEGRLLTLIEAVGLPATQEKALKDLIKKEIWELPARGVWASGEEHTRIRKEAYGRSQSIPTSK